MSAQVKERAVVRFYLDCYYS